MQLANEFKQFLLRGNVVDLAIAVVIGAAFGDVVTALVADLVTPLIAAIGGQPDFSALSFTINGSTFSYGHFLNTIIAFVMIAAVIFFFVIKPINVLISRATQEPPPDPATKQCEYCFSIVPIQATRCAHCTSEIGARELVSGA